MVGRKASALCLVACMLGLLLPALSQIPPGAAAATVGVELRPFGKNEVYGVRNLKQTKEHPMRRKAS
jgi:hypothetical protein